MKIGIISENPLLNDKRVPLLPEQIKELHLFYPDLQILVQASHHRCIADQAYRDEGIKVKEDISECDYLMSINPPEAQQLIPLKSYLFFSEWIHQKPENRALLKTALQRKIKVIDYECITNQMGQKVVDFGRFAGIVGAYDSILAYGRRYKLFQLKPALMCKDIQEIRWEFNKVKLPPIKIVVTGLGNVVQGIDEVLQSMGIQPVNAEGFLTRSYNKPVYTILRSAHYYRDKSRKEWDARAFYENPENFEADFLKYASVAHIFVRAHHSSPLLAPLFTKEDMQSPSFKIKVICDVACGISPLLPESLRNATLENPFYDFNPHTNTIEESFSSENHVTVMAVENLSAELPLDASRHFGKQLLSELLPAMMNSETDKVLQRATLVENGRIMPGFLFLERYLQGKD